MHENMSLAIIIFFSSWLPRVAVSLSHCRAGRNGQVSGWVVVSQGLLNNVSILQNCGFPMHVLFQYKPAIMVKSVTKFEQSSEG
jgi:hypothetical protein